MDARYLGINDKAKAAESADKASAVEWSGVANTPNLFPKVDWARSPVNFSSGTFTAPENGMAVVYVRSSAASYGSSSGSFNINGKNVVSVSGSSSISLSVDYIRTTVSLTSSIYVAKDDKITGQSNGTFYYLVSEENEDVGN